MPNANAPAKMVVTNTPDNHDKGGEQEQGVKKQVAYYCV